MEGPAVSASGTARSRLVRPAGRPLLPARHAAPRFWSMLQGFVSIILGSSPGTNRRRIMIRNPHIDPGLRRSTNSGERSEFSTKGECATMKSRCQALSCLITISLVLIASAAAQDHPTPYPKMAPLDQYLMPSPDAEVALARSAAPEAISRDAEVRVLGRHGYELAVKGTNGWACVVERAWMSPFDAPNFWNPKIRGATCFNPVAVHYVLPATYKRTELILAGLSKAEIIKQMTAAYVNKQLPGFEPGGMSYMMSKQAYLVDQGDHNLAHLMFYEPIGANWGSDLPKSPVLLGIKGGPAIPFTLFIVPVGVWSDGSPAPVQ